MLGAGRRGRKRRAASATRARTGVIPDRDPEAGDDVASVHLVAAPGRADLPAGAVDPGVAVAGSATLTIRVPASRYSTTFPRTSAAGSMRGRDGPGAVGRGRFT